jgi:hypothetical protein
VSIPSSDTVIAAKVPGSNRAILRA